MRLLHHLDALDPHTVGIHALGQWRVLHQQQVVKQRAAAGLGLDGGERQMLMRAASQQFCLQSAQQLKEALLRAPCEAHRHGVDKQPEHPVNARNFLWSIGDD